MAEIHRLPFRGDPQGAHRLAGALEAMIENGPGTGSREAQIRGLGLSLGALVAALRVELVRNGVAERLAEPVAALDRLAARAGCYGTDAVT